MVLCQDAAIDLGSAAHDYHLRSLVILFRESMIRFTFV